MSSTAAVMPVERQDKDKRVFALDAVRVVLTLMVTVFHALSELTWMLTTDEVDALMQHPAGRIIPLGYTAVDGFMVLTGLLTMSAMLRKWSTGPPTLSYLLDKYYDRMVTTGMPLAIALIWYGFFFRHGKYPDISIRSETVLLTMRMVRNTTSAVADGSITADGAFTTIRGNGISLWPWIALYVNNMSPFGGLLQQTWSLAVQMQWYMFLPITPHIIYCVRKVWQKLTCNCNKDAVKLEFTPSVALKLCAGGMAASLTMRVIGHRHLSQFNPSSIVGFGAHFFWYADTYARLGPLFAGAVAGILSGPQFEAWVSWLVAGGATKMLVMKRNLLVATLSLTAVTVCFVNAFWKDLTHMDDEASPALAHELMYSLCRPGGTLSAIGYTWVVFCVMHGISWLPILRPVKEKVEQDTDKSPNASRVIKASGTNMLPSPTSVDGPSASNKGSLAPTATNPKTTKPSALRRVIIYFVPITFMVYLVNSTLYEQFYGWPQRLHPCPQLLHDGAGAISDSLIHAAPPIFPVGSTFHSLNEPLRKAELILIDSITAGLQFLRGPSDLYCQQNGDGQTTCSGLCFSNEKPDVEDLEDASCMMFHNCTMPPMNAPRSTLQVPFTAWVQFWHFSLICVAATWFLAWLFFLLIEVPLGTLLLHPIVKKILFVPVILHAALCMLVSIPFHLYMHYLMFTVVTPAVERSTMHAHLA